MVFPLYQKRGDLDGEPFLSPTSKTHKESGVASLADAEFPLGELRFRVGTENHMISLIQPVTIRGQFLAGVQRLF